MDSIIHILCATDDNYAPYCGVMLTSLFESNKGCRINIYLLHDRSISYNNKKKFYLLENKYGNSIQLLDVDKELVSGYFAHATSHDITLPTFYRLICTEILPKELHKVIYLDCDVIVNGDISTLWNIDIDEYAVAAVKDCRFHHNSHTYDRLGYLEEFGYFNAGILLINMDYWRDFDLARQFRIFYQNAKPEQLWMMDQDVLNSVLYDKKFFLAERFNFQTEFFLSKCWNRYPTDYQDNLVKESNNALFIHYCGSLKPWSYRYNKAVFYDQWNFYRKKSLWKRCRIWKPFCGYTKYLIKKNVFPSKLKGIWINILTS